MYEYEYEYDHDNNDYDRAREALERLLRALEQRYAGFSWFCTEPGSDTYEARFGGETWRISVGGEVYDLRRNHDREYGVDDFVDAVRAWAEETAAAYAAAAAEFEAAAAEFEEVRGEGAER